MAPGGLGLTVYRWWRQWANQGGQSPVPIKFLTCPGSSKLEACLWISQH